MPVLELKQINKSFSGVRVLEDISISLVKEGTILGLVGENGAGKSTMMNILGGVIQRDSGNIFFNGKSYNPKNAKDADSAGIALIHQELNLFPNMTISENIYLNKAPGTKLGLLSYREMNLRAKDKLKQLGLNLNPGILVEELSMGMRQMVEIVKALSRDAKLVVFDEPTTSLSNKEKEHLFRIIRDLSSNGISMIYISHTLDDVLDLCDEVVVIRDGKVVGQSVIGETNKEKMISMMVGRKLDQLYPYVEKNPGEEVLCVDDLCQEKIFHDITFSMRAGEIVGMYGLMGAGRSELARAIYGLDSIESGSIVFKGKRVNTPSPEWWIKNGMAFITENRREEGLLLSKSIKENLILANLRNMRKTFGAMDRKGADIVSDSVIQRLEIKTYNKSKQEAQKLSGGNQQKVVFGKWLLTEPKIFIVDEPTRGVDVGAKFEIYNHLNSLALEGSAILFISSEMEELIGVCDRILVMSAGTITGELQRESFDQEELLKQSIRSIKDEYFSSE